MSYVSVLCAVCVWGDFVLYSDSLVNNAFISCWIFCYFQMCCPGPGHSAGSVVCQVCFYVIVNY